MTAPTSSTGVILTDAAAEKAKSLLEQEGRTDLSLRIAVQMTANLTAIRSMKSAALTWSSTRCRCHT